VRRLSFNRICLNEVGRRWRLCPHGFVQDAINGDGPIGPHRRDVFAAVK